MIEFHKGHNFQGPDGQGYALTKDVETGDVCRPSDFEPYGGAPTPEMGKPMPKWLEDQIWPDGFGLKKLMIDLRDYLDG